MLPLPGGPSAQKGACLLGQMYPGQHACGLCCSAGSVVKLGSAGSAGKRGWKKPGAQAGLVLLPTSHQILLGTFSMLSVNSKYWIGTRKQDRRSARASTEHLKDEEQTGQGQLVIPVLLSGAGSPGAGIYSFLLAACCSSKCDWCITSKHLREACKVQARDLPSRLHIVQEALKLDGAPYLHVEVQLLRAAQVSHNEAAV